MKKVYITLSVLSEFLMVFLLIRCILMYSTLYGAAAYYVWNVIPTMLLIASHIGYVTKKWYYLTVAIGVYFLKLLSDEDFSVALAAILLVLLAGFSVVCFVHQKAVSAKHEE